MRYYQSSNLQSFNRLIWGIHGEFVLVNNVLRKYNELKEEIKNPGTSMEYII